MEALPSAHATSCFLALGVRGSLARAEEPPRNLHARLDVTVGHVGEGRRQPLVLWSGHWSRKNAYNAVVIGAVRWTGPS